MSDYAQRNVFEGMTDESGARADPPLLPESLRLGQAPSGRMMVEGRVISVEAREAVRPRPARQFRTVPLVSALLQFRGGRPGGQRLAP
jgi:hypothetical protein